MSEAFTENSSAVTNGIGPEPDVSPVHGLHLLHLRSNHSYIPNLQVLNTNTTTITSFATRNAIAGKEITLYYNTDFESRNRRSAIKRYVLTILKLMNWRC